MTIHVQFDSQVQEKAGGSPGEKVTAATVREALYQVAKNYPSLRLFNCEGEMRSVFHVRQGGTNTEVALDAPVQDGGQLTLTLS